jgi:hypothetical protein
MPAHTPARSRWHSTPRLLLLALFLCLLGVGLAVYPTVNFLRSTFEDATEAIAEFDANTDVTFNLPDADTRYTVGVIVDDLEEPVTWVNFTIDSPMDPGSIQYEEINSYFSVMGRSCKNLVIFECPSSLTVSIHAESERTTDIIIYRHQPDMLQNQLNKVTPWWVGSGVPFATGICIVIFVIFRKVFQKDDLTLEF